MLTKIGGQVQINTYTSNTQNNPKVFALKNNMFMVMWNSPQQDGFDDGIYAQRYDAQGNAVGAEFRVNTYTTNHQQNPSLVSLADGGFVVVWQSRYQDGSEYGIYGQRYDAQGNASGTEFRVNTYTNHDQPSPSLVGLADGGFVVVWQSYGQDGSNYGIYAQRYDAQGNPAGTEFRVNTYTNSSQEGPLLVSLADGGFVVVWVSSGQEGINNKGIYAQRYDAQGNPVGGEFRVNTYTSGDQEIPSLASLADGGFVVVWVSELQDGSNTGVYAQRYDAEGNAVSAEFRVNTYTTSYQQNPSLVSLVDGGFVVVWESLSQDGGDFGIYAQRYDAQGNAVGAEFRVNTYTINDQQSPSMVALADGGFVVVWQSYGQDGNIEGIYAQRYDAQGNAVGAEFRVNTYTSDDQQNPAIAIAPNGNLLVAWEGEGQTDTYGIYGQFYYGPFFVTNTNQTIAFTEDQSSVNLEPIYIYSAYNNTATTTLTLSNPQAGSLSTGTAGSTTSTYNNSTGIWQASGAVTNVNTLLANLTFQPKPNHDTNFTVAVQVSDGFNPNWIGSMPSLVTAVNDLPTLINNSLTITEGQTVVMTSSHLQVTDIEATAAMITFTASNVQQGQFELVSNPGVAIANFTQQQVNNGQIQFKHSGNNAAPSYSISASDGIASIGPFAASINFSYAPPVLNNKSLTINEGQRVTLTSINLSATDPDVDVNTLTFIVSQVQNGQFEHSSTPGVAINSFTQQQVINGQIQFAHNGGEQAPSCQIAVTDGFTASTPVSATITFTNINDAPVFQANQLTILEGGTVTLTSSQLLVSDPDNTASQLQFTVSNVQNGRFELAGNPGVAITQFTQQQVLDNQVRFVQDGTESAPTYSVTVSDGVANIGPNAASITFTKVNDVPQLLVNSLVISEGQSKVLDSLNLQASDEETSAGSLTFIISNLQHGKFELASAPGIEIGSFTQQQLLNSNVVFIHDGGEIAPSYQVAVSDGTTASSPSAASVTFTNLNDAPVLVNNNLWVNNGQTKILTPNQLSATDSDDNPATLLFTVSNVQNGRFERIDNPGFSITQFTQQDITLNQIQFVHIGNNQAPTYSVTVSDGKTTTAPASPSITFNVFTAPQLVNNQLLIEEGKTYVLTSADMSATDLDGNENSLQFIVSNVKHGRFTLVSSPGTAITSFTQQQIKLNQVQFIHDGGENPPSYDVVVRDINLQTSGLPSSATITFININDAPIVAKPMEDQTITQGKQFSFNVPSDLFYDGDGDSLTLVAKEQGKESLPEWIAFNAAESKFSGEAPSATGLKHFSLFASDMQNTTKTDFALNVIESPAASGNANQDSTLDIVAGTIGSAAGLLAIGGAAYGAYKFFSKKFKFSKGGETANTDNNQIEMTSEDVSSEKTKFTP